MTNLNEVLLTLESTTRDLRAGMFTSYSLLKQEKALASIREMVKLSGA
jgi:hypothetical protein